MTLIALTADTHADQSNRWSEHCRIMDWLVEDWRARGIDVAVHAGDHWERRSTPIEREYVAGWVQRVAEFAPLVTVSGNHGDAADVALLSRLRTRHPVVAADRPMTASVAGIAFGLLPWPRKGNLLAALGRAVSPEAASSAAQDALRNILRGLGDEMDQLAGARVLVAHAMVDGSKTSLSQPLVGQDMNVTLSDLALARANLICLGHVHCGPGNEWEIDGAPAMYPGTPWRGTFGDLAETGYVLAHVEYGEVISWERVPTPSTPMLLMEAAWHADVGAFEMTAPSADSVDDELDARAVQQALDEQGDEPPVDYRTVRASLGLDGLASLDERGAEVRFRYSVDVDARDAAREQADRFRRGLLDGGAARVQVEEIVRASTRSRAPEIALAKSVGDKLRALWKARNDEPEPARAERLLAKVAELEEEAAA